MPITQDLNILKQKSTKVNQFEAKALFNLLKDEILKHPNALGLSAIQLEIPKRMFVIKIDDKVLGFMNPKIISKFGPYEAQEGCLSIPDKNFKVTRYKILEMRDDLNGRKIYKDSLGQVLQHEFNHLSGLTLYDTGKEII